MTYLCNGTLADAWQLGELLARSDLGGVGCDDAGGFLCGTDPKRVVTCVAMMLKGHSINSEQGQAVTLCTARQHEPLKSSSVKNLPLSAI